METQILSSLPNKPGVYFFKDKKGEILYIGKAKNLQKRVAQYFSPNSVWKQDMIHKAETIDFVLVNNEGEALYLEDNLIKKHKPEFNNLLKGDNSYTYIKITKEAFPQIFLTRKKVKDGSLYIGPKHNSILLKKFLQYFRQLLQWRGCKNTQFRQHKLCSDYYFGLCKGWCALAQSEKLRNFSEAMAKDNYQKIISVLESFFKGNTKPIETLLNQEIQEAIKLQHFEWAGKLRDIYLHVGEFTEKQTVVLSKPLTGHIFMIKEIGEWFVYVLIYFYEGKLVDIISQKVSKIEYDEHSLIVSMEAEFGDFVQKGDIWVSKNLPKIANSDMEAIEKLLGGFIDSFIISHSFEEENLMNDILSGVEKRYGLKRFPYRIECIDISHLGGDWTSGGLSCLLGGIPYVKGYRRYKIEGKNSDDYASLEEVFMRRFAGWKQSKSGGDDLPDVFILDGGKGQLGVVKELALKNSSIRTLVEHIDIVALGKGAARKSSNRSATIKEKLYFFEKNLAIASKDLTYDQIDKPLIQVRDEAHRFANAYRKKQMKIV